MRLRALSDLQADVPPPLSVATGVDAIVVVGERFEVDDEPASYPFQFLLASRSE